MSLLREFGELENDVERWQWLQKNQGKGLVVMLDNDDTFLTDNNDADDYVSFDNYIGWSSGVFIIMRYDYAHRERTIKHEHNVMIRNN